MISSQNSASSSSVSATPSLVESSRRRAGRKIRTLSRFQQPLVSLRQQQQHQPQQLLLSSSSPSAPPPPHQIIMDINFPPGTNLQSLSNAALEIRQLLIQQQQQQQKINNVRGVRDVCIRLDPYLLADPPHQQQQTMTTIPDSVVDTLREVATTGAPHLENVTLHIISNKQQQPRICTIAGERIGRILNIFPNRVTELKMDHVILSGEYDDVFLRSLRSQTRLTTLCLDDVSPLPGPSSSLPSLFLAVSALPILKQFRFSSCLNINIDNQQDRDTLVRSMTWLLLRRPNLTNLDLRQVGVPEQNSLFLSLMLQQTLHHHHHHHQYNTTTSLGNNLEKLTIGNAVNALPQDDCHLFSAVGDMLKVNRSLQHLSLYIGSSTVSLSSSGDGDCGIMAPIEDALRTNKQTKLCSLKIWRQQSDADGGRQQQQQQEGRNHSSDLIIPETFFVNVLEKDNATLQTIEITTMCTDNIQRQQQKRLALPRATEFYLKLNKYGRGRLMSSLLLHQREEEDDDRHRRRRPCSTIPKHNDGYHHHHSATTTATTTTTTTNNNNQDSMWFEVITACRDYVDLVYYYLRQNPDLVNPNRCRHRCCWNGRTRTRRRQQQQQQQQQLPGFSVDDNDDNNTLKPDRKRRRKEKQIGGFHWGVH